MSMNSHVSAKKNSEVQLLQKCLHLGLSTGWKLPQGQGFCCTLWDVSRGVCREDTTSVCFVSQGRQQWGKNTLRAAKFIYLQRDVFRFRGISYFPVFPGCASVQEFPLCSGEELRVKSKPL